MIPGHSEHAHFVFSLMPDDICGSPCLAGIISISHTDQQCSALRITAFDCQICTIVKIIRNYLTIFTHCKIVTTGIIQHHLAALTANMIPLEICQ